MTSRYAAAEAPPAAPPLSWLAIAAASLATCAPSLMALNALPSPTFFNQAAALAAWGLCVVVAVARGVDAPDWSRLAPLLLALATVAAAALGSWLFGALPAGLALSALALLGGAALLVVAGAAQYPAAPNPLAVTTICWAFLIAGLASAAIALLQVFAPDATDGELVARTSLPGRAVGNLRQPNHLSTLLLWSAVAIVPLIDGLHLKRPVGIALYALLVLCIELTASRTGMVGVLVLAAWGMLDRRLARTTRAMLLAAPLLYVVAWYVLGLVVDDHTVGAAARLSDRDVSGSRFGIWSNTLALIAQQPWLGTGFGEYNLAWTLTPFPGRPTAFFDHAHNLPLQLLAELGVPLGGAVLVLLGWALWRACRSALALAGDRGVEARSLLVIVLMMAIHSQLEYPLWYAYFLLPTAWAWGQCLRAPDGAPPRRAPRLAAMLAAGGFVLIIGAGVSVLQYLRVSEIFEPVDHTPLGDRIAVGQRQLLVAHHADYAAATTAPPATDVAWHAFDGAAHYLLDTRLMLSWARVLAARGDLDRARHVAQRAREFRNPQVDEFFAPCTAMPPPAERPFQCDPPSRPVDWREFRTLY